MSVLFSLQQAPYSPFPICDFGKSELINILQGSDFLSSQQSLLNSQSSPPSDPSIARQLVQTELKKKIKKRMKVLKKRQRPHDFIKMKVSNEVMPPGEEPETQIVTKGGKTKVFVKDKTKRRLIFQYCDGEDWFHDKPYHVKTPEPRCNVTELLKMIVPVEERRGFLNEVKLMIPFHSPTSDHETLRSKIRLIEKSWFPPLIAPQNH